MTRNTRNMSFGMTIVASLLLHAIFAGSLAGALWLAAFFGWSIFDFDALMMKPRDIEFVLVSNPEQQPRNKNTKNRSDRATRAGGEKTKLPENEPMKKAGNPKPAPKPKPAVKPQPKPQPKRAVKKPTPKPQPKKVVKKPTPKPTPKPKKITKTPPKPKLPKPVKTPTKKPTLPPNPIAPTIKTPAPPSTKIATATGPVFTTQNNNSSRTSKTGGPVTSSQISGKTSQGNRGSRAASQRTASGTPASWTQGRGGRGSYNQAGSPGGGPGRPGIDALPDPDYGAYMAELQRRIKRNWRPPTAQEDKRVQVLFKIARDGRLTSLNIQRSSGYPEADAAALAAVKLSAPFRPLPVGHRDPDLAIQFTFDYNVYKSGGGGLSFKRR